jgi:hypothetical protein
MKKTLLALALAAGLTSFAGSAKAALTYNWSFNNDYTSGSGWGETTSGTITGTVGQGGAFRAISATYSSGSIAGQLYFPDNRDGLNVTSGILSGGFCYDDFALNYNLGYGEWSYINITTPEYISAFNFGSGTTFSAATGGADTAAVPEPSQVAASLLLVGGIAGFVIVRRRKLPNWKSSLLNRS